MNAFFTLSDAINGQEVELEQQLYLSFECALEKLGAQIRHFEWASVINRPVRENFLEAA